MMGTSQWKVLYKPGRAGNTVAKQQARCDLGTSTGEGVNSLGVSAQFSSIWMFSTNSTCSFLRFHFVKFNFSRSKEAAESDEAQKYGYSHNVNSIFRCEIYSCHFDLGSRCFFFYIYFQDTGPDLQPLSAVRYEFLLNGSPKSAGQSSVMSCMRCGHFVRVWHFFDLAEFFFFF